MNAGAATRIEAWRHPAWWIATLGGIGRLPKAPGTWGSATAALAGYIVFYYISIYYVILLILFITLVGWWASSVYVRRTNREDPQEIVIDEVAGQLLALLFAPHHWAWFALGFGLFRAFDIVKPFPVSWFDRHLPGGLGVMADDLMAGIYAMLIMLLVVKFVG